MKYFIYLFFICLNLSAKSQDCKILSELTTIHGLVFGQVVPDSILKLNAFEFMKKEVFILKDSLKGKNNPYLKFFRFGKDYEEFSNLSLTITNDKKLQTYCLWSILNSSDLESIKIQKLPHRFFELLNRFNSMFGQYSQKKSDENEYGMWITESYTWSCPRIQLILTLTYGAKTDELNHISLTLKDIQTEKLEQINQLKH